MRYDGKKKNNCRSMSSRSDHRREVSTSHACRTRCSLLQKVRAFDAFTEDNDRHGEHDFGSIDEGGVRCFWKIDYYDRATEMVSPDPAEDARRHASIPDLERFDVPDASIAGRFSPRL